MKTVALIVAAGKGERTGAALPKQYAPLAGRAMLAWSHQAFGDHPAIDEVLVVIGAGQEALLAAAVPGARHVTGGATRRESVAAGLAALDGADLVLVHDAARPFLSAAVIDRLIAALATHDGAVPVLPVADTLVNADGANVPREALRRVQTPQAFRFATLAAAHRAWRGGEATDDAQMVRALGGSVALVQGDTMLEKITYPGDIAAAEARLGRETRSALGFDVHRLADGEELWLGGVLIPHHQGLSGHSDADVALHAITDALLGTIAAGDIGMHFPPSDPQWRGAESGQFLRHALSLVEARGGRVTFVDLTLMCEAPKIGPHRDTIRARIGELLALPVERVSVKATTTERLGFTGRGEGIAAQAIVTVDLPGATW
ncbi:bifunctional 2-C-methyl-D-erythritol 4-phosphate cytidylyltransferase/2-C-methyl-D-erythritol 2,4-cyclodiphosphate synthase [Sphingomonas sp. MMSM20]|uniref:bifunctional 2-C-methyl-D-erythritol 4-phosphate cytidylyltransferase/2-C-methyl-D-erythritol 2,4-cyclodiphosphate synthase n=1 Tax=Sphingomonas lycopersici TaxID=2951807 RepID=UPI0022373362|nr:bifunctional 2-C-methyl-D-erythritol 4-phosphate cytidylyltransferase/2-C-methyl-D-erythritol 2,4-cyclodiphosphate synthase [Sphingomonas lycopersici]MCW6529657.1 bifunctional 2-C-methyl-D-erythritol 4-phosphate cytidylyltransferase/2-C-methyl-D-erythritol 2,4-cyclodiphosphate synthase [Sphingomonas lycopersici]